MGITNFIEEAAGAFAADKALEAVDPDAGVLAIKAPGAEKITVLSATKDIQGNRKELSYAFAEEHSDTLHPGDYLVQVTFKGDVATKEMPASVKAGERSEVTVQ